MTENELLSKVKIALGVTGNYLDETLEIYISEVKQYIRDSGVPDEVLESSQAVGVIARGVADLWGGGSSGTKLSEYFFQRVTQLKYRGESNV